MPDPQISRRCPACGASIREAALFCPQCGDALQKRDGPNTAPLTEAESATPQSLSDTIAIERPESLHDTIAIERPQRSQSDTGAAEKAKHAAPRGRAGGTKLQRAGSIAREVEGDMKHRVQKVRQLSSVVIDEAGYDPSLRFVLVAAGLFLLFIILMVLNKFIT